VETRVTRQAERKTRQLCRQIQRTLNLALADAAGSADIDGLFVDDVTSAGGGPLLVHVIVPPDRAVGDALAALRGEAPRLRAEVARAIVRKRAPELAFVPALPGAAEASGDHDA
jgi:ribosome-binding factor A